MNDLTPEGVPAPPPAPPPLRARGAGISRRTGMIITSVGLLIGGIGGGYIVGHAATSSTTTSPSTTAPAAGTFHSNEDPSHEAGESAQREAQENAGQMPTVP